jgi:DNA-binding SARP family transcriptional activator/transcriptional regulator with XRE-family HTH domain
VREHAHLGRLVRERRHAKGLSQLELAVAAGIGIGVVRDLEQGTTMRPRASSVGKLLRLLEIDDGQVFPSGNGGLKAATGGMPSAEAADPMSGSPQVLILGPLEAWHRGMPIGLGPPRQQALLGLLALRSGRVVGRENLLEALWDGEPPPTAVTMIHSAVSRLRRVLASVFSESGEADVIARSGDGYRLVLRPDMLDAEVFSGLCAQARAMAAAGDVGGAYARYERALALWRGQPLAGLGIWGAQADVSLLFGERAAAIMEHASVASELGFHDMALRNLRTLTGDDPFDERAHACLMITLASVGQQATALEVFDRLRRRLADELGISPCAELRAAHERVLRQEIPVQTFRYS